MIDKRLSGIVARIQRLEDERADISKDISDVYAEAKSTGYDTRILRQLLKRLRMRPEDRSEADMILSTYESAVGADGEGAKVDMAGRKPRERFVAPQGASSEEQLRAIISRMLELRAERNEMGQTIRLELRKARACGFDPVKITEACRWLEKCDANGRDRMIASEELYQVYREIGEGPRPEPKMEGDSKLVAMFAGADAAPQRKAPTLKQKHASDAVALAQASLMNRPQRNGGRG